MCPYENEERRVRRRRKRASNNGTRLDVEDVKDGKVEERYRYYLPTMALLNTRNIWSPS